MTYDLALIVSILSVVIALASASFAAATYLENRRAMYLAFYNIIEKHHSRELTELRRAVRESLDEKAKQAIEEGKSLFQIDQELHAKVSTLANYYESLGMFLQGAETLFPKRIRNTMLEMLHNSVTKHWEQIDQYKKIIHPSRPMDWAQSFQWLYNQVAEYRKEHVL